MFFYGITIILLEEDLQAADPGILSPFYTDDAEFSWSARRSAQLLNILMNRGRVRGYFPELAKSIFILDILEQEEEAKREFVAEVLELNLIGGSWHLGGYLGPQEELGAWLKPQVEAWDHRVRVLVIIAKRHPQ